MKKLEKDTMKKVNIFKIKKVFLVLIFGSLLLSLLSIPTVMAHCPLCTAAAAGGVAVARFYGVDDSIVGLLLGAVIVSTALWFGKWMKKKDYGIKIPEFILVIASFLIFAVPFYYASLITNFDMVKSMPEHHGMSGLGVFGLAQFGVDKLLFGMILGSLVIWGVFWFSDHITKKREKRLFDYQGLIFMLVVLIILSGVLYLITKV